MRGTILSALNLIEVLWDERQALAGRQLHFPAAASSRRGTAIHDPGINQKEAPVAGSTAQVSQDPEPPPENILEVYRKLNADNRWALCLSRGGIRSAAFALGVLQRIAALQVASKHQGEPIGPALQQFEYLSTVSGGGYIGSWLSAWLFQQRRTSAPVTASSSAQACHANEVVAELNQRFTGAGDGDGRLRDHEEAQPIVSLRRDSHYLAPSFSAISPDLWSDVAGILRNLALNWVLLVPPMIFVVVVTKALYYAVIYAGDITQSPTWFNLVMIAATVCFIVALSFSAANRPARGLINASQPLFLICDLATFLLGAALLVFVLRSPNGLHSAAINTTGLGVLDEFEHAHLAATVLIRGAILGLVIYLTSWWLALLWPVFLGKAEQTPREVKRRHRLIDLISWCVAGTAFGGLVGAGLLLLWRVSQASSHQAAVACVFGVPWIVSARIIADVIFISSAEFIPGADAGLECQARSSGIFTLAHVGWLIWFGLVLLSPLAADGIEGRLSAWLAAAGSVSGAFSVIVGASSKTNAVIQSSGLRQYFGLNTMAAVAAAIFASVLVSLLSIACNSERSRPPESRDSFWPASLFLLAGACATIWPNSSSLISTRLSGSNSCRALAFSGLPL
jgi:hypothetical protein